VTAVPYQQSGEPIIIRRADIESLLAFPKRNRDQLVLSLPALMGFRVSEVRLLRKRQVDIENGCIYVEDSKKAKMFPVPMPYDIAKLIEKCLDPDHSLVVRRLPHTRGHSCSIEEPLTREEIYHMTKRYASRTGIPNWHQINTTLLRHFFAANWIYKHHGSVETLRRIMRHKSLAYTQIYLGRLVFFEDLKREVDRLTSIPNLNEEKKMLDPNYVESPFYEKWCAKCSHRQVCKFIPEACDSSPWSSGCRRFSALKVEVSPTVQD